MTETDPAAIASGTPYRVTHVDGAPAGALTDFLGDSSFLIHLETQHLLISGVGAVDRGGNGIRFYQKDPKHEGRDIRIWQIRALHDNQFIAEHVAAI